MKIRRLLAALSWLAAVAGPASAATMHYVFTGIAKGLWAAKALPMRW